MRVLTAAFMLCGCVVLPSAASASSRLLYVEAQGVVGYSDKEDDIIFHSESGLLMILMQKMKLSRSSTTPISNTRQAGQISGSAIIGLRLVSPRLSIPMPYCCQP
jgi:hypothetical protein